MGFLDKYPYTDFHELNLDWFLERFRELAGAVEGIQHTLDAITPLIESLPEYEQLTDQIKIVLYGDPEDPAYPNTGLIWKVNTYASAFDQLQYDFNELSNDVSDLESKLELVSGLYVTAVLPAGSTTLTVSDASFDVTDHNKMFEIYTEIAGLHPQTVIHSGTSLTMTFASSLPMDIDVTVHMMQLGL